MFGAFFYAVFLVFAVPSDEFPDYQSTIWIGAALIIILFVLRMFSILLQKSHKLGEKVAENALMSKDEKAERDAKGPEPEARETYLQMLLDLYYIGPFIALGLAVCGPLLAFALSETLGLPDKLPADRYDGVLVILVAIVGFLWLILLEKLGKTTITFPIVPIPLTWLMVPLLGFGGYLLITGTTFEAMGV